MRLAEERCESRSAGEVLADQLVLNGVNRIFCVPGESYLSVLDALYDKRDVIQVVNARHEAAASQMAEAHGKLVGRPGVCFVTRGPGACHAAVGVHTAFQDSTPMVLFVGQVERGAVDREAFQEIDYRQMFSRVAKWVGQVDSASRIPEYVARAFQTALSGRPGPVVLALPEDMLFEQVATTDARPAEEAQAAPSSHQVREVRQFVQAARRPLVLVGGSTWTDKACKLFQVFAESSELAVATSFRRQDLFQSTSASFVGDLGMSGPPTLPKRFLEADLLLVIGSRLGEFVTQGYTIMRSPVPEQQLIHVHPDPETLGSVFQPDLSIVASSSSFAKALGQEAIPVLPGRSGWTMRARAEYVSWRVTGPPRRTFDPSAIMAQLRDLLTEDAIVTVDAGNHAGWPQRFLDYGRPGRQLGPTNGSMGYSLPAAISAAMEYPERQVVSFVGDGGFMMTCSELATAKQYDAKPIVIVFNNRMYATIRMHQERRYPGRVIGTDLVNPDFVGLARSMGAHAEAVRSLDEFGGAFERSARSGRVAVIELCMDQELISTREVLSDLGQGLQP